MISFITVIEGSPPSIDFFGGFGFAYIVAKSSQHQSRVPRTSQLIVLRQSSRFLANQERMSPHIPFWVPSWVLWRSLHSFKLGEFFKNGRFVIFQPLFWRGARLSEEQQRSIYPNPNVTNWQRFSQIALKARWKVKKHGRRCSKHCSRSCSMGYPAALWPKSS